MILITRRLAKTVRKVFRQALGISTRAPFPLIHLDAGPHGLRIRCGIHGNFAEYHLDGDQPVEQTWIPFELLAQVEGTRDVPVEIQVASGRVTASWQNGSVPQTVQHDVSKIVCHSKMPPLPEKMSQNAPGSKILKALADAMETVSTDSVRYAIHCVQLQVGGRIVATDGRQLLVQSGFSFPWKEDLLLPKTRAFGCRELLATDEPVEIGKADKWIVVRTGPWTFWWEVNAAGRFPDVKPHIPDPRSAAVTLRIHSADAAFLAKNLPHLPFHDEDHRPVTIDLNGQVVIRARSATSSVPTELRLARSSISGEPLRLNTNRKYLAKAVRLGFETVRMADAESPLLALDTNRQYVWVPLDANSAIGPSPEAVIIDSDASNTGITTSRTSKTRKTKAMSQSQSKKRENAKLRRTPVSRKQSGTDHSNQKDAPEMIRQAEAVRTSLRETLAQTAELVRVLKRHRKQSRAVENALASLRELQPTG